MSKKKKNYINLLEKNYIYTTFWKPLSDLIRYHPGWSSAVADTCLVENVHKYPGVHSGTLGLK